MTSSRPGPRPVLRLRVVSLGRFFGVPIAFAPSWLLIAGLLTAYYGPVVQQATRDVSASTAYLAAFAYAVVFALCVLAHEMGHTAVSLLLGHPVKRIVIFLLGGVSEIDREPDRPRDEFLIALAGPVVSAVLTVLVGLAYRGLTPDSLLGVLLLLLFWSNLVVVVFNLLPGLPLDGGRVLRAGVWAVFRSRLAGSRVGAWAGRVVAVAVVITGPVLDRGEIGLSIVSVLLAVYLWYGAGQALRVAEVMDRLPGLDLDRLLRPGLLVPPDLSIAEALRRMWQGNARGLVLIDAQEHPAAIVDEAQVNAVAPERRPWVPLSAVARPLEAGLVLPRTLRGEDLLDAVRRTPASEYLVVDERGAPAGILTTADLAAALGAVR